MANAPTSPGPPEIAKGSSEGDPEASTSDKKAQDVTERLNKVL